LDELSCVSSIGPDELKSAESFAQAFEDQFSAVAVLHGGFVDDDGDNQAECVDDNVAFSPVDLLARVISAKPPFSVVLTDWLSMMAALGVGLRPQARRTCSRKVS
jgi:hypothetical protein